jgi:hypothetical protein
MNPIPLIAITAIFFGSTLFASNELDKLKAAYESSIARATDPLKEIYKKELEKLAAIHTREGRIEDATKVMAELQNLLAGSVATTEESEPNATDSLTIPSQTNSLPPLSTNADSVIGKFYICVDESGIVFLNGTQIIEVPARRKNLLVESNQVTLKVGDHLVFQLYNNSKDNGLLVQFVSTDGKTIIHFPSSAYRRLNNPKVTMFTELDFRKYQRVKIIKHPHGEKVLPYKSNSNWVWGDTEMCALAVIVTRNNFGKLAP